MNGAIVQIMEIIKPDDNNPSMWCFYHHVHGYLYAFILVFN